jgi:chemotaxis protein methyltransferase CheR
MTSGSELQDIEIESLLERVAEVYGYDFRDYSEASVRRRMIQWLSDSGFASFAQARVQVLRDPAVFEVFLRGLTVN